MTDLDDTRWCPTCGAHDNLDCLTPSGRDHRDRPKRTKQARVTAPDQLDLQAITDAARGLVYVSDGTRGSDRVARLLASVGPLVEALTAERARADQAERELAAWGDWENEAVGQMHPSWDADEAQINILNTFIRHAARLDAAIEDAREADGWSGRQLTFLWDDDSRTLAAVPIAEQGAER